MLRIEPDFEFALRQFRYDVRQLGMVLRTPRDVGLLCGIIRGVPNRSRVDLNNPIRASCPAPEACGAVIGKTRKREDKPEKVKF